jgi:hypothetical protein
LRNDFRKDVSVYAGFDHHSPEFIKKTFFFAVRVQKLSSVFLCGLAALIYGLQEYFRFLYRSEYFVLFVFIDCGCVSNSFFMKVFDDFILLVEVMEIWRVSEGELMKMAHDGYVEVGVAFE